MVRCRSISRGVSRWVALVQGGFVERARQMPATLGRRGSGIKPPYMDEPCIQPPLRQALHHGHAANRVAVGRGRHLRGAVLQVALTEAAVA